MVKYIDADQLKAEIERRKQIHKSNVENGFPDEANKITEDNNILSIIKSLQQEQPDVDLGADIEMEWDSFNKHLAEYGDESDEVVWLNWNSFNDVACHFYELGKNSK